MVQTLSERQKTYEEAYEQQIIRRVPVIIRVDGKNFHRVTRKLQRPYSADLINLMASTMISVAKEIEGCVFAYQQSDEITFVLRNDQSLDSEPWFNNRLQKITSITASLTTYTFKAILDSMPSPPELVGVPLFDARVFAVPSINEAINNLIFRQQDCIRNSITAASQAELTKEFGRKTAYKMLHGKNSAERMAILAEECGVSFEKDYPLAFRYGVAAYKIPKLFETNEGQVTRLRWILDTKLPKFSNNRAFVQSILHTGRDIFRVERDLDTEDDMSYE